MDRRVGTLITPGLIQVYTGDSKGKTTAAIGQVIRAIGHGNQACIIQYMKGSSYYGEITTFTRLAPQIEYYQYGRICSHNSLIKQGESDCLACGECFVTKGKASDFDKLYTKLALERSHKVVKGGQHSIVVLDEILNAIFFELIDENDVLHLIDAKPDHVELILTGRNATEEITRRAHLVTEMKKVKHPYDLGIMARRGIEY